MLQSKLSYAMALCAMAGLARADSLPVFSDVEITVVGQGISQTLGVDPVDKSVMTADDIAKSGAQTVPDLLSTMAGINVYSNGGSAPTIDVHGFGQTASGNTLILIDGIRQNTNDLRAPDVSGIPLSMIERIEVQRASGAVQYGNGATGGVINIITKVGAHQKNSLHLRQTFGSFDLHQSELGFNLAGDRLSLDGFGQSMNTHHYRQNAAERNDGGGLGLNLKLDQGKIRLFARSSSDSQGLSGARKISLDGTNNQMDSDPSGSSAPLDHGTIKTDTLGLQGQQNVAAGQLNYALSSRAKKTTTVNPGYYDLRDVHEDTGNIRYAQAFGSGNKWQLGVDWLSGNASAANSPISFGSAITQSSVKQRHLALFGEVQLALWQGASVTTGARVQRVDDLVQCTAASSSCNTWKDNRELHAWQLGLSQDLSANWRGFANISQSFRLPNADELVWAKSELVPQLSHDKTLGVEWAQQQDKLRLALFRSDLTNEIQLLPLPYGLPPWGSNVNLPATRHQGIELEGQVALLPQLLLQGNLTWQQARYRRGSGLDGHSIPMVPAVLANLGVSWAINQQTSWMVNAHYTGSQYLDNDQANSYPARLAAYTVVNTKLTYQLNKPLSLALAVNNLLDRHYATYGIASSTFYSLYPADPRNYQLSLTLDY